MMFQYSYGKLNCLLWEQVCQTIVDTVGKILDVDIAILLSYEQQQAGEHYFFYQKCNENTNSDNQTEISNFFVDPEILKKTVRISRKIVVVNDVDQDELTKYKQETYQAYQKVNICSTISVPLICDQVDLCSGICTPLICQSNLISILTLHHCHKVHRWEEEEIKLAMVMAAQASLALEQIQAYEQVRDLAQRETIINRITTAIRSSLEPQAIFASITKELGQALAVDGCTLSLWTKDDEFMQCVSFYNPNETNDGEENPLPTSAVAIAENPILQKLLATRKPVFLEDLKQQPEMARYDLPLHSVARALLIVPLVVDGGIIGSITLRQSASSRPWRQSEIELAEAIASQAAIAVQQARLYETTRQQAELLREREKKVKELNNYLTESVLKRFLPETLVNKAALGELVLDLTPEPYYVTILFADLVGFTPLSNQLSSVRLAELLNEYLEAMAKAVFEQSGTVDKFIGDGVMALFGAPESLEPQEQAQRAIATAKAMHHYLQQLNQKWQAKKLLSKKNFPSLQLRCGIHQGQAVVGMFGGRQRKDYTAIGATVNIASRLQQAAEAGTILASGTVAVYLEAQEIKQVQSLKLKGIEEQVIAFSLVI